MKTKHTILAVLFSSSLFILQTNAQGIYGGIGGGYGFPTGTRSDFTNQVTTINSAGTSTLETYHPISFGKGINSGLYIGYMFNKNIGAELGASYLFGGKTKYTGQYIDTNTTNNNNNYISVISFKGNMIRLIPTLRMTVGEKKLMLYMKAGLIIGLGTNVIIDEQISPTQERVYKWTEGMSFGFHGAVGINYMLTDKLGIYCEMAVYYQNWAPKKQEMTKFTTNGIDELSTQTTADRIEYFSNHTTILYNGATSNPNEPSQGLKREQPFSSIGANIGIHFNLTKNNKQ